MSRGVDRQPIFFSLDDRRLFGELLGVAVRRFGLEVHAYCLMTNHFHLLVRCPAGGLSDGMQWLLSMFATQMNRRLDRVGHFFGGRFVSRLITDVNYLANVVRYVHLNPLDVDGVEHPGQYRWSSHRTYLGLRPAPDWFTATAVSSWFDDPNDFDRFVCAPLGESGVRWRAPSSADELLDAVDFVVAERSPARSRTVMAHRRAVALSFVEQAPEPLRQQMLDGLGIRTPGALRAAQHRAHRLTVDDPSIDSMARRARLLLAYDLTDRETDAA